MAKLITSQPTIYNGIQFRSKLEAKTAQALDIFGMRWQYEPQGYKLSNGMWYKPDFWLVDAHQFIECKGSMTETDSAKIIGLVNDTSRPVIVLSYENAMLCMKFWNDPNDEVVTYFDEDSGGLRIGRCSECGGKWFYANCDTYACQCCGAYDGDHHLDEFADVESATQLFNYAQQLAAHNPIYKDISTKFNREV